MQVLQVLKIVQEQQKAQQNDNEGLFQGANESELMMNIVTKRARLQDKVFMLTGVEQINLEAHVNHFV